jgi:hypothetical protein
LMPELSFGTHFFQDLVESDIFYAALFPDCTVCSLNKALLTSLPNCITELVPEYSQYGEVVHVIDIPDRPLQLLADIVSQQVVCLFP